MTTPIDKFYGVINLAYGHMGQCDNVTIRAHQDSRYSGIGHGHGHEIDALLDRSGWPF
jgi:hypothetical protein